MSETTFSLEDAKESLNKSNSGFKKHLKETTGMNKRTTLDDLKSKVIQVLYLASTKTDNNDKAKLRNQANELVVKYIEANFKVKTIREDIRDPEMYIYADGIYISQARTYISEICRHILGEGFSNSFVNKVIDKVQRVFDLVGHAGS